MQKKALILGGISLVVLTIVLFVYVFFVKKAEDQVPTVQENTFNTPSRDTTFEKSLETEFSSTSSTPSSTVSEPQQDAVDNSSQVIDGEFIPENRFTLLSSIPVVGMAFLGTTTVRYSEQGTGQLIDLNLATMNSQSITTNLTGVFSTTFNINGSRVIMKINDSLNLRFFAGVIIKNARNEQELRGTFLPYGTVDAIFTGPTNIRYLLAKNNGGEIHTYEPSTRADTIESTIPFNQAYFITSETGALYLVSKPSAGMDGAVYRYSPTGLHSITKSGRGLTAFAVGKNLYTTAYRDNKLTTTITTTTTEQRISNILRSETCVQAPITIYCARPFEMPTEEYPDRWYRGEERGDDFLFTLNPISNTLISIASPEVETGQIFDIIKLVAHPTRDDLLLLINKNNGSLWLFTR